MTAKPEQETLEELLEKVDVELAQAKSPLYFKAILRRKLLPLLQAGEAMREKYAPWDNCKNPECSTCSIPKSWDAAKLAALKGDS